MDYKKYSLENLETWLYDAMSCGDATPQEIYDVIIKVVKDEYYTYKQKASESYELLALLKGNSNEHLICDKDDKSPKCQKAWNDFWEENYYPEENKVEDIMPPWGHSDMEALRYTEEELNAMCEKAALDEEKNKCREYNLREAEYYDKRAEIDADKPKTYDDMIADGWEMTADGFWIKGTLTSKELESSKIDHVNRWVLPVNVDGLTGECYINLPDDLLERAGLKEGSMVQFIDRKDGSFELRKVNGIK